MRVFLTGATGFVGSAIVKELTEAGHSVTGLARSDASASALAALGAETHRGSLDDLDSLRSGAAASDGVVHCAFIHDFSNYRESMEKDRLAVEAIVETLAGSDRPFINTNGVAVLASGGRLATEDDAGEPESVGAGRLLSERAGLAGAERGVRAMVVRLAPSVHGAGDHGFVPALIGIAREKGVSAYVGDGSNRWAGVHRSDAARLYRLALEKGKAGARYHAIADEGVPTREIAEVIGRQLNLPAVAKSPEEAGEHFGWIARFFGTDIAASSALTQERLGWRPTGPSLLEDLDGPAYFEA